MKKHPSTVSTLTNQDPYAQERMALIKKAKKEQLTYAEKERAQTYASMDLIDYLFSFKRFLLAHY